MKAQRSALLLSGLLLLMIVAAWAQTSDTVRPSCPPLDDAGLQDLLQPSAWVRADWNANTSRWDIDCRQMDAIANMPPAMPFNAVNSIPPIPGRTPMRSNANFVNRNAYNAQLGNGYNYENGNANMAANAVNAANARRPRAIRREPNTRKPGE